MASIKQPASPLDVALGQVLRIPCKFIKGKSDAHPIVIKTIAQELKTTGKNILPVIVKQLAEDKYQAVLNTQILEGARQAKSDFVWCIVVDEQMQAQVQVESGQVLRVNILTAPEKEVTEALEYIKTNKVGFNKIDVQKIANAIVDYRKTNTPTSLAFLTKCGCGIGKAKLPSLAEILVTV
jgi:hypothetical protein